MKELMRHFRAYSAFRGGAGERCAEKPPERVRRTQTLLRKHWVKPLRNRARQTAVSFKAKQIPPLNTDTLIGSRYHWRLKI